MTTSASLAQHMAQGAYLYREFAGLGDAVADQTARFAALTNLDAQFEQWRNQVLAVADSTDDSEGMASNLRNLVASAARSFNRFIDGDTDQGAAMQRTMQATNQLIQEMNEPVESLQDLYIGVGQAVQALVVNVTSTAGSAGGALIKSAANELGVEPKDLGGGLGKLTAAAAVIVGGLALWQVASAVKTFRKVTR